MSGRIVVAALVAGVAFSGAGGQAQPPAGHSLTVTVTDVAGNAGVLRIALFTAKAGFPDDFTKAAKTASVKPDKPTHTFDGMVAGEYVVVVHHDRDGDGAVKKSLIGVPTEPIGLSNHPKLGFGNRPDFDKAVLTVKGATRVRVNLVSMGR